MRVGREPARGEIRHAKRDTETLLCRRPRERNSLADRRRGVRFMRRRGAR